MNWEEVAMSSKGLLAGAVLLGAAAGAVLYGLQREDSAEPGVQLAALGPEVTVYKTPT
jgi:hypothetical protein